MKQTYTLLTMTIGIYFILALAGYWFIGVYQIIPLQFGLASREEIIATVATHFLFANYAFSGYFLGWFLVVRKEQRLKWLVAGLATILMVCMYMIAGNIG